MAAKVSPKNSKPKTHEDILAGFQTLRQEQRLLAQKLSEIELDMSEHRIVIDTLRGVDSSRKCFRIVGSGVLVQRTVAEILPELESTREQLPNAIANLQEQLTNKGAEINAYIETNNIRLQRNEPPPPKASDQDPPAKTNVLVTTD